MEDSSFILLLLSLVEDHDNEDDLEEKDLDEEEDKEGGVKSAGIDDDEN